MVFKNFILIDYQPCIKYTPKATKKNHEDLFNRVMKLHKESNVTVMTAKSKE